MAALMVDRPVTPVLAVPDGARLRALAGVLDDALVILEGADLSGECSADLLAGFVAIGRLADAGTLLVAHPAVSAHPGGVGAATAELARDAGLSKAEAERTVATSKALASLERTRLALRAGWLSKSQAHLVAEGATVSPDAELALLGTAQHQGLVGLRRHVERIKAADGDERARRERAHAGRDFSTFVRGGKWHMRASGPVAEGAEIELAHRPFRDAAMDQARTEGRVETFGNAGFDGLVEMARAAADDRHTEDADTDASDTDSFEAHAEPGGTQASARPRRKVKKRRWQAIIRVDATAIRRGHTTTGEICEIPGVGPIDVARAIELLGEATVRVLITDTIDVLSIVRVDRYIPPALQAAVREKSGFECANHACSNTGWLELDHTDDISRSHDTSYRNLWGLCGTCHDLKTYKHHTLHPRPDGGIELRPPPRCRNRPSSGGPPGDP
jgi:hypothetical protein